MPLPTDAEAKKLLWPPTVDGADDVARWAQWYSGNFVQASYAASKTEGGLPERLSGGYVHRHAAAAPAPGAPAALSATVWRCSGPAGSRSSW